MSTWQWIVLGAMTLAIPSLAWLVRECRRAKPETIAMLMIPLGTVMAGLLVMSLLAIWIWARLALGLPVPLEGA